MTSATESSTTILRRMLDERGVEWRDGSDKNVLHTTWNNQNCWFNEFPDGWTAWGMAMHGTPEQAVAATLGRGECQATMHLVELEGADGTVRKYRTSHYDTECGRELFWPGKLPPYCPYCGRRLKGDAE